MGCVTGVQNHMPVNAMRRPAPETQWGRAVRGLAEFSLRAGQAALRPVGSDIFSSTFCGADSP